MFEVFKQMKADVEAVFERDPAARNLVEVLLCYSGLHAIMLHRLNHALWKAGVPVLPRFFSQLARFFTGIEIHPGAKIGKGFFIDHGSGVVIGETTEIGDNVTLYQGVTLGGTGKEQGKRHPTVRDNVVIGAGTKVLGAIEIGSNSKIGAGAVVIDPVPPHSTVVGPRGRVVRRFGQRVVPDLNHRDLPDPVGEALNILNDRLERLEKRLAELKRKK